MIIDINLTKKWFREDLSSKSIRELRINSELKQNEFDAQLVELLEAKIIYIVRFEYDEVGDQIPVEYALTQEALEFISEFE